MLRLRLKINQTVDLKVAMVEWYTAEEVLELLNDDLDVSEGDESEFYEDGIYSYLPEASADILDLLEPGASLNNQATLSGMEVELDPVEDILQNLIGKSFRPHKQ